MFFLWSNQTVILMFFMCFAILCFTLTFILKSCVFSISTFFLSCDSKGALELEQRKYYCSSAPVVVPGAEEQEEQ